MSDWKDDLGKLKRRPPSQNILQTILNVMASNADDRSVAILAGSLVEVSLIGPIALSIQRPANIEEDFWHDRAPYRTFNNKIVKAKSLEITGPQATANLEVIRLVRNTFAHSLSDLEFAMPEIARACARLILSNNAEFFVSQETIRAARYRYCRACDVVFRVMFNFVALQWITGSGLPGRPSQPLLP
jgi:hypothetical protein